MLASCATQVSVAAHREGFAEDEHVITGAALIGPQLCLPSLNKMGGTGFKIYVFMGGNDHFVEFN